MSALPPLDHEEIIRRISRDLADSYDEELEMEVEDHHPLPGEPPGMNGDADRDYRRRYFSELFRLQAELVKLQDWVVATREKVVILRGDKAVLLGQAVNILDVAQQAGAKGIALATKPPPAGAS